MREHTKAVMEMRAEALSQGSGSSWSSSAPAKTCFQTKKLASLKATLVGIYDPVSESAGHRVEGS